MNLNAQIAKLVREFYFGDNWTGPNLQEVLADVTWQHARAQVYSFNTIGALVFHMNYYVRVLLKVVQGQPPNAGDKYSFDLPPIQSQQDWDKLLDNTWTEAEVFASQVEQMPESKFWEDFLLGKYGNFYRNIQGILQHNNYHLGQIVLIKKMILLGDKK
jgi:hypothetical protein